MSEAQGNDALQTVRFVFNGRRFARQAADFCSRQGLQFRWTNDQARPAHSSMTVFEVTGTARQLREFVVWDDRHYRKGQFSAPFAGEPFMDPRGPEALGL
jgi:hypothetical protein